MEKLYIVKLEPEERAECERIIHSGKRNASLISRAHILLSCDESEGRPRCSDKSIAEQYRVRRTTVEKVRQRFVERKFPSTLYGEKRSYAPVKILGDVQAHIIAISRSQPPSGTQSWTLHRIAERVVELKIVESISHESVRQVLKKTTSSRTTKNNG